jgi:hypothetical protein
MRFKLLRFARFRTFSVSGAILALGLLAPFASDGYARQSPTWIMAPDVQLTAASFLNHPEVVTVYTASSKGRPERPDKKPHPSSSPPPAMGEQSGALTFTAMEGESNPHDQTITVTNTGGGTLSWTVSENASWLSVTPTSGTTTTETDAVTVRVNTAGLLSETYDAVITLSTIAPTVTSQQMVVTLILSPASATIGPSPTSLVFPGIEGGSNPTSQRLEIKNIGKGTLNWSASASEAWLTFSPTAGTTTTEIDSITVSANAAGMQAGSYTTTITVTDPVASNSRVDIPVTLVLSAPQSGTAELTWLPNTESNLAGYRVHIGTTTGNYLLPIDVGNATSHKLTGLSPGQTYYFAVTAYNTSGIESGYSNEASKSIP